MAITICLYSHMLIDADMPAAHASPRPPDALPAPCRHYLLLMPRLMMLLRRQRHGAAAAGRVGAAIFRCRCFAAAALLIS